MAVLRALESLGRRTYGGWGETRIEWEGAVLPHRFLRWSARLREAWPDAESRADDPAWASEAFLYHYLLGLRHGYPECCVMAYATTAPHHPVLAERRVGFGDYVPCASCLEAYLDGYLDTRDAAGPFPLAPA